MKAIKNITLFLGWLYAAGFALFLVIRDFLPQDGEVDLINTFIFYIALPNFAILLIAILTRSRRLLFLQIALSLWFLTAYGYPLKNRWLTPYTQTSISDVTILSANLGYNAVRPDAMVGSILAEDPDILAFQEPNFSFQRRIQSDLLPLYPYTVNERGRGGVTLLSKYPILAHEWYDLTYERDQLKATLRLDDGELVDVFVVHLPSPPIETTRVEGFRFPSSIATERTNQYLAFMQERFAEAENPAVIVGDFNASDQSKGIRQFSRQFTNVNQSVSTELGFTWPNADMFGRPDFPPLIKIDHAFTNNLTPTAQNVNCTTNSDHCYLVINFKTSTDRQSNQAQ